MCTDRVALSQQSGSSAVNMYKVTKLTHEIFTVDVQALFAHWSDFS
jgi:hypothetical protein